MKTVKITSFALLSLFIIVGCAQNKKENSSENTAEKTEIMQIDALLNNADSYVDKVVTVEGICTHICRHGGRKIFLMGTDDTKTIRVEAGEEIGSFKQETVNSIVEVTGELKEQRIDQAYLADWETRLKEQTEEKHGDGKEAGCAAEQKAQNEAPANTVEARIENFRKKIAKRKEKEGKDYLSFYYINGQSYQIK